jgi:peptidoglycan/xylan/chitin deacetylase (PgdA/CDA1 family)
MIARRLRDAAWQAACGCARPWLGGLGCVLTLHRIVPEAQRSPLPSNRALEITPEDLRAMLQWLKRNGIAIIGLDEVPARLQGSSAGRFVSFTFDDGYRDNLTLALPIFREFGAPFAVNVTNGFIAGTADVWWYFVERVLGSRDSFEFSWNGESHRYATATTAERNRALDEIAGLIRSLGLQRDELLKAIAEAAGVDAGAITKELCMTWDEVRQLAADPLVTIGAHTAGHHSLNRLTETEIVAEVETARQELAAQLGRAVRHFAYPFGGPNAVDEREFEIARRGGFASMLTTRAGNLTRAHAGQLDRLPRLTISGNYPVLKALRMAESGLTAWREKRRGREK